MINLNPFYYGYLNTGTFANSEDPDEMPHTAAFHQGLHCMQYSKQTEGDRNMS